MQIRRNTRTKRTDLQQICNRSVLAKTDHLQTNLSSAESVFSLLQTIRPDRQQRFETADGKQIMNRSAADLLLICNFPESRNSAILAALAVITAEDGMRSVRSVFTVFSYVFLNFYLISFLALKSRPWLSVNRNSFSCQEKYVHKKFQICRYVQAVKLLNYYPLNVVLKFPFHNIWLFCRTLFFITVLLKHRDNARWNLI